MNKGLLIIISSPSGGGKTTVLNELLKLKKMNFKYSISATTRKPRNNEIHGKDYFFISEQEFVSKIKNNEFLEWEKVHQYYYGTPKEQIENWLSQGDLILFDVDVNGGLQIKRQFAQDAITIFIEPPSIDVLIERLKNRNTESGDEIEKRLLRVPMELEKKAQFDFVVINKLINQTVDNVLEIINEYRKSDSKQ